MDRDENRQNTTLRKRTRDSFIDAARRLFARFGVEKTTMNDIAEESHRGRRTIYMYFQSKLELFNAVVSRELELLSERLLGVAESDAGAPERLVNLIYTHLETIYQVVMRNGSLRASFFNDISRLERIRFKFDRREQKIISGILEEGNRSGLFSVRDVGMTAQLIQSAVKGFEVPYINLYTQRLGSRDFDRLRQTTEFLLFRGIGYRGDKEPKSVQEKDKSEELPQTDNQV